LTQDTGKSGLWAALFIILLLPFLFLRQGAGSLSLAAPRLGLPASIPRANVLWDFQGSETELPVWLGGPLLGSQYLAAMSPTTLVALDQEGKPLWREEVPSGFKVQNNGKELLLALSSGQITLFDAAGVVWGRPSVWPAEALALASDGRAAVVRGPVLEGTGSLIEEVSFFTPSGAVIGEQVLRNTSSLKLTPAASGWLIATVGLGSRDTKARLSLLTDKGERAREIWSSPELIQTFSAQGEWIAAAGGSLVHLSLSEGESHDLELTNPASHLAWTQDGNLLVAESGGTASAPSRVTLLAPTGKKLWQRRLRGPCRGLFIREDTVLVADNEFVYALGRNGKPVWCYEAPINIEHLLPLAVGDQVLLQLDSNRLLLLVPSVPAGS
jgi:hypothetical protein